MCLRQLGLSDLEFLGYLNRAVAVVGVALRDFGEAILELSQSIRKFVRQLLVGVLLGELALHRLHSLVGFFKLALGLHLAVLLRVGVCL